LIHTWKQATRARLQRFESTNLDDPETKANLMEDLQVDPDLAIQSGSREQDEANNLDDTEANVQKEPV
jgi:hypothetical protein